MGTGALFVKQVNVLINTDIVLEYGTIWFVTAFKNGWINTQYFLFEHDSES